MSAFSDEEEEQKDDVQQNPLVENTSEDAGGQLVNGISDEGATGYSAQTSWDAGGIEKTEEAPVEAAATLPEKKKLFNKNRFQKAPSEAFFYQCTFCHPYSIAKLIYYIACFGHLYLDVIRI